MTANSEKYDPFFSSKENSDDQSLTPSHNSSNIPDGSPAESQDPSQIPSHGSFLKIDIYREEEHKSFASEGQSKAAETQDDVKHHFTAFIVNANKQLVEFDGMKQGPHVIKEDCTDCLKDAAAEIQRRLQAGEISEQLSVMTLNAL